MPASAQSHKPGGVNLSQGTGKEFISNENSQIRRGVDVGFSLLHCRKYSFRYPFSSTFLHASLFTRLLCALYGDDNITDCPSEMLSAAAGPDRQEGGPQGDFSFSSQSLVRCLRSDLRSHILLCLSPNRSVKKPYTSIFPT